jgi:transcriptional regulator with XRE-family HTH domain
MDELKLIFASNLIRLRTAAGMTQAELGEQLNYSDKSISKWERGEAIPDAAVLKRMSEIFGVTVDYLLDEHDAWQPAPDPADVRDRSHASIIQVALTGIVTLAVLVLLVWSLGYFVSIVWRKGQNPLDLQGKVNLVVSLLVLVILVLLNSPVLDSMRISVNSHMARYQSGKNTPDQVTIYMLEQSGRYGRAALESLKSDAEYMKDPKRARDLLMALDGEQHLQQQVSEKVLADNVLIAPGSGKPDATFWSALIQDRYNVMTCIGKDACVLVEQDLNSDGQAERILFAFNDDRVIVYGFDSDRKEWDALDMSLLPRKITKEKLLTAAKDGKLGTRPKAWRDLVVDGERLDVNLNE